METDRSNVKVDRELLEMAAKAADYVVRRAHFGGGRHGYHRDGDAPWIEWDPLHDDGDALRLAVALHMTVRCYMGNACAQIGVPGLPNAYTDETNHVDPTAATRRAIVRAAAAMFQGDGND